MLTCHDHIISHAPLQNKVRRSTFIFCIFYVADGAYVEEPFLPTKYNHNADIVIVSITPHTGPSIVNAISTIVGDTYTR